MKLLSLQISRPEFFNLQQAIDNAVAAQQVLGATNAEVETAKSRMQHEKNAPTDPDKLHEWELTKNRRGTDLAFAWYAREEALFDFSSRILTFEHCLEAARKVATTLRISPLDCRKGQLNCTKAAELLAGMNARAQRIRDRLFDYDGDRTFFTNEGIASRFQAEERNCTVRFRVVRDDQHPMPWQYQQSPYNNSSSNTPPRVAFTMEEAVVLSAKLQKQLINQNPGARVLVEVQGLGEGMPLHPDAKSGQDEVPHYVGRILPA